MYKETLEILMEGITCPIKEQILKNQLEYHFKNKTPENQIAIDNTTGIARRVLEDINIFDIISVQPITNTLVDIETITNPDNDAIDAIKFGNGLVFSEIENLDIFNFDVQDEVNHAIACEINDALTNDIINDMLTFAPETDVQIINITENHRDVVGVVQRVSKEIDAAWAIMSPLECAIIKTSRDFKPSNNGIFYSAGGLAFAGTLNNTIDIYTSLDVSGTIILGSDDNDHPPITFAPETLIVVGDDHNNGQHELLTKSEIFVDAYAVKQRYRKISIKYENNQI